MEVTSSDGAGSGHGFYPNPASTEEVSVDLGGGPGEANVGAVQLNYVPKAAATPSAAASSRPIANEGFQSDNLSPCAAIARLDDGEPDRGGVRLRLRARRPIRQRQLWFFTAHRIWGNSSKLRRRLREHESPRDDLRARPVAAGGQRLHQPRAQPAADRPAVAAQQPEPVVRSAGQLRLPSRHRERRRQRREHVARGGRPPPLRAEQHLAGDLELSGDQPSCCSRPGRWPTSSRGETCPSRA